MARDLVLAALKREKNGTEVIILDRANNEKIKVFLRGVQYKSPYDILAVYDSPPEAEPAWINEYQARIQVVSALGRDGKTYWFRLAIGQGERLYEEGFHARLYEAEERKRCLESCQQAERAGRYLDAADCYEYAANRWGDEKLLDKARECREKAMSIKSEVRVIAVDVNTLIRQLKESGIVAAYKCPNCGAVLKITGETRAESLKFCNYCGAKIDTVNLVEFLKSVLPKH